MHYLYESFQSNLIGQPYDLRDSVLEPFSKAVGLKYLNWKPQTTPPKITLPETNIAPENDGFQ